MNKLPKDRFYELSEVVCNYFKLNYKLNKIDNSNRI